MSSANYVKETQEEFDAIVVGSGMTGGIAAKEFCEKGFKTLMIERGPIIEHRKDYIGEGKPVWDFPHRMHVDKKVIEEKYQRQQNCYAFNDATKHFFGNDKDLPYSVEDGTDFQWSRANQLGGKSLLWHRKSYRFSDYDFNANKADGHGVDWPIRYKDVAPWYSYVEKFVGISGSQENLPQLPDSDFLPPYEMTIPERDMKGKIERYNSDYKLIIARTAHLTKPQKIHLDLGRYQCQARDECQKGCSFGAYYSTLSGALPAAAKTGNLTIAPNSVVHSLIFDDNSERVKGVRIIDNEDLSTREYFGKVVFLCASTLGSTQVLMNTKTKKYPNGLANQSGALGHYLMDHNYGAKAGGTLEGYDDVFYSGRRPTGVVIPNTHYEPKRYNDKFVRGFSYTGGSARGDWKGIRGQKGIGLDFKQKLTHAGDWGFGFVACGEMLPRYENEVQLHPTKKDKWGMPILHFNCSWSDNERIMMEYALENLTKMLEKIGVQDVKGEILMDHNVPGFGIHEVGTARMGRDPKTSVLNGFNQAHHIPNLFVTDGASYASIGVVNPSLTFMALTARAVDYYVKEHKAKRI